MTDLERRLRGHVAQRAETITHHDADLMVTRALARPSGRPSWTRHGLNAIAAVVVSLVLIAGGVVLGMQLHALRTGSHAPSPGPLPAVPNEIVNLHGMSQSFDLVTPYRLTDRRILTPRPRWILAPNTGLMIDTGGICDLTWIHVVDLGSPPHDKRPPVSLPGCYVSPTLVPKSTVILMAHVVSSNGTNRYVGTDAYDWAAGRVLKTYDNISTGFAGGVVSADGKRFYTLLPYAQSKAQLQLIDLVTGAHLIDTSVDVVQVGLNPGGIALSPDGGTLYVNEGMQLQAFDAHSGQALRTVEFKGSSAGAAARLPGWLSAWLPSAVDAQAKESFEPGHGLAIDPNGRWVAVLGIDDPAYEGIWIFDTRTMRLIRHISNPSRSLHTGFRDLAASLDGSVLYALYLEPQQGSIEVIDPRSGRMRVFSDSRFSDLTGIAGVDPAG